MMRTWIAKIQLLFRYLKHVLLYLKEKKKVKSRAKSKLIQQMLLICNIKLHPPAPRLFFATLSYYETANNSHGFQLVIVLFV